MTGKVIRELLKRRIFMEVAVVISQLGTCDRAQVGAVLVRDGRCISWGFNGAPPGAPHCEENFHGWDNSWEIASAPEADREDMIRQVRERLEVEGCRNATHAEANALAFAARQGISTDGAELFITVAPCAACSRLLIAAGVSHVTFLVAYRDHSGEDILREAGVECSEAI